MSIPTFAFLVGTYLPDALLTIIVLCAFGLWTRWHRQARVAVTGSVVLAAVCLFTPLSALPLRSLESRVARSDINTLPAGVIVLADELTPVAWTDHGAVQVSSSAELLTEAANWYTRHSDIKLLLFVTARSRDSSAEADACLRFWSDLGIPKEHIAAYVIPSDVRDPASFIRGILEPDPGKGWILISPAAHMYKAKQLFERQNIRVFPWPTDYRTSGTTEDFNTRRLPQWSQNLSIAIREYIELWL